MFGRASIRLGIGPHSSFKEVFLVCDGAVIRPVGEEATPPV